MAKRPRSNFEYTLDIENEEQGFGVWNLKSFRSGKAALAYAESLAKNNPGLVATVRVEALAPRKNVLRTA